MKKSIDQSPSSSHHGLEGESDYHPLTKDQIKKLLLEASFADMARASQIQVRLSQGIPGIRNPRAIDGPARDKECKINALFVEGRSSDTLSSLVDQFYQIMNS